MLDYVIHEKVHLPTVAVVSKEENLVYPMRRATILENLHIILGTEIHLKIPKGNVANITIMADTSLFESLVSPGILNPL